MREVLEKFDFDNTISKLDEAGLLFQVLERFRFRPGRPFLFDSVYDCPPSSTFPEKATSALNGKATQDRLYIVLNPLVERFSGLPAEERTDFRGLITDYVRLYAFLSQVLRQDDKGVTHAVLETIAAFLNTEGGDLQIGVGDDASIVGVERDRLERDDKFMRHLAQVVRSGLGDRAGTCIDPKCQVVQGKTVRVVSCQRRPELVFLKWKGLDDAGSDAAARQRR